VWFKGGTSLSKGFSLIERFSEDLDLKIEAGRVLEVPSVRSWKSEGANAIRERKAFFEALLKALRYLAASRLWTPTLPTVRGAALMFMWHTRVTTWRTWVPSSNLS